MSINLDNLNFHSFAKEKITVFISYAWFDENDSNHGKWVSSFKNKLELLGIDPIFDRQDARNSDCREFMKKSIEESDFVICICSDKYVERYNKEGEYTNMPGASNEGELITKRIQMTKHPESFLIPIVKNNSRTDDKRLPDVFPNMFWRDFDGQDSLCAEEFYILGDTIFGIESKLKQIKDMFQRQRARDYIKNIFRELWLSTSGSDEEQKWSQKWNQTQTDTRLSQREDHTSVQQETDKSDSLTPSDDQKNTTQDIKINENGSMLWANLLGQWDDSYPGDNDIICDLGGLK